MRQRNILFDKKLLKIPGLDGSAADYSPVAARLKAAAPSGAPTTNTTAAPKAGDSSNLRAHQLAENAAKENRAKICEREQAWGTHGAVPMKINPATGKCEVDTEAQIAQIMNEQLGGNSSKDATAGGLFANDPVGQALVQNTMERKYAAKQGLQVAEQQLWQQQHGNNMPYGNGMMGNTGTTAAIASAVGTIGTSIARAFI